MRRVLSFHLIKPEHWDRYKYLRGGLAWGMILCTLGAAGNWYNLARGTVHLDFPMFLTLGALTILAIVPKKWELITWSVGGVFVLSILQMALRRFPPGSLEVIGGSGILFLVCSYIAVKLKGSERRTGRVDASVSRAKGDNPNDDKAEQSH